VAVYEKEETAINFSSDIVYLNNIKDPGNLGTILRSSVAFGIENIVLDENCVDVYNPKTIQASKDAIFKLNIAYDKEMKIMKEIKEKMPIFVTNVQKGEELDIALSPVKNICILLGNESFGVSDELEKLADKFINIKTTSKIESLNVAIGASIIFYELFKIKNNK
jgi:TrmH family RNA methyltransferase